MRLSAFLSIVLSAAILLGAIVVPANAVVTKSDFTAEELDCPNYDIRKYTNPFWEGNIVYNEIVHPIRNADGSLPVFYLMYYASDIISVKDYKLKKTYVEGVDYRLNGGYLEILPTGNIPIADYEDIHPSKAPAGYGANEFMPYYPQADGSGYEYWTSGSDICTQSLAVTYIHNDIWKSPSTIPESQEKNLPKTFEKLKNDEELTIVLVGDSVAAGAMSSGFLGISPSAEAYPEMTVRALREKYSNDNINLINSAIGGTMSHFYKDRVDNNIIAHEPDLVIMNYGMNDSSCDRVGIPGSEFKNNHQQHIDYIKQNLPDCEILLVSSLYGNRYTFPAERYEEHAAILHDLAAENSGVGVADPQRIEKFLIENIGKDYVCFTADNMVHPGDLGMRLTCQTILEALSFDDPSSYREHLINGLREYADIDNQPDDKKAELTDVIDRVIEDTKNVDEEWDLNAIVDQAYYELKVIILRCDTHTYVDTIYPPTCKAEGYTISECSVCGFRYEHSPVPNLGGEHAMDSGRQTVIPTYKTPGEITYSCARCPYTETEKIPVLTNAPTVLGQGMIHYDNNHSYMDTTLKPYTSGNGSVEFDFCPLNIERFDGTAYVGVWFSNYSITACYNFTTQQVQIVETSLPFGGGTVHASADYSWPSNGGKYEYNWKKFCLNISGSTVSIYIDGELALQDTNSRYSARNEVALIYSNGECYLDNIKVVRGSYNPTSGIGGTTLGAWDINSTSSYNSFFSTCSQSYAARSFVTANKKNVTTGHYAHVTHSGTSVGVISNGCSYGGCTQYACSCGEVYFGNYTSAVSLTGHTLTEPVLETEPTETTDGVYTYGCTTCSMTFREIIPRGTDPDGGSAEVSLGDVDGDGVVTMSDLATLRRVFASAIIEINEANADITGDGVISVNDVAALARMLVSGA